MRAHVTVLALLLEVATQPVAHAGGGPEGLHVSFGADPRTTATVSWFTSGTDDPGSVVEYGAATDSLTHSVTGTAQLAFGVPTTLHDAMLTGLIPGAEVFYRAGAPSVWSAVHSFHTAPATGSRFSFTVFSDHGTKEQSQATTAAARADTADFHVMAGDLSYANAHLERWDDWARQIEPLAAERPMVLAPGNHETDEGPDEDTRTTFTQRFALPGEELWYSIDYGRAHLLVLHSTIDALQKEGTTNEMLLFAEADLRAAAQRRSDGELDWIFVIQHHPLYGSAYDTEDPLPAAVPNRHPRQRDSNWIPREEALFQLYGVDVLLCAHNHHYERTTPMVYGTSTGALDAVRRTGFIEVISGGGGQSLYTFKGTDIESWSVTRAQRFHYMKFEIDGKNLTATAIATDAEDPAIIDRFTVHAR